MEKKKAQGVTWRSDEHLKATRSLRCRESQVRGPYGPGCHKTKSRAKQAREKTKEQKNEYYRLAKTYGTHSDCAYNAWFEFKRLAAISDRLSYEAGVRFKDSDGVMRCSNAESFVEIAIKQYCLRGRRQ